MTVLRVFILTPLFLSMMRLQLVLLLLLSRPLIPCSVSLPAIISCGILALWIILMAIFFVKVIPSRIRFLTVSPVRYATMNSKLKLLIFCLKNLPRFIRLCVQLLEEWYKFEMCQNDEVGVL